MLDAYFEFWDDENRDWFPLGEMLAVTWAAVADELDGLTLSHGKGNVRAVVTLKA